MFSEPHLKFFNQFLSRRESFTESQIPLDRTWLCCHCANTIQQGATHCLLRICWEFPHCMPTRLFGCLQVLTEEKFPGLMLLHLTRSSPLGVCQAHEATSKGAATVLLATGHHTNKLAQTLDKKPFPPVLPPVPNKA